MALVDFEKLFLTADNFRDNGQVKQALSFYKEISELASQPQEARYKARAFQMAAASLNSSLAPGRESEYRDSIAFLQEAIKIYQNLGDEVSIGASYRDQGIAASKMNDPAARNYYQKAIEQLTNANDPGQLAITYDKFGMYFYYQGDASAALDFITKALALYPQVPNPGFFYATTLYDKSKVLISQDNFEAALDSALESLSWFEADHGDKEYGERICEISGVIGSCYGQIGELKKAKQYLEQYQKLLKRLDPEVAIVIEHQLEQLFSEPTQN